MQFALNLIAISEDRSTKTADQALQVHVYQQNTPQLDHIMRIRPASMTFFVAVRVCLAAEIRKSMVTYGFCVV
jgi:hypothetical protein